MAVKLVARKWADIWFSNKMFNPENGKELEEAIKDHPKAINTFTMFPSPIK